jgi:ABC-type dipeptide/oligopeptide/nickel transport system permease subunit
MSVAGALSGGSRAVTAVRSARVLRSVTGRVGVAVGGAVLLIGLFGPFFAPHSPAALVGAPFSPPSAPFPLGTDVLGRDVLSRVLCGGRTVIALAGAATLLGYVGGLAIGLVAGYNQRLTGTFLMRVVDVLLAFPPVLFLLVLATGAGPSPAALVIGVAITHVPSIARIVRAATLEVARRGYVEAAVARGERPRYILRREIAPNVLHAILADVGVRVTWSILLVAAVNFLGLGLQPPQADWALMIAENRSGLAIQPWAVVVPGLLIATLTIACNLIGDAIAESLGVSVRLDGVEGIEV